MGAKFNPGDYVLWQYWNGSIYKVEITGQYTSMSSEAVVMKYFYQIKSSIGTHLVREDELQTLAFNMLPYWKTLCINSKSAT